MSNLRAAVCQIPLTVGEPSLNRDRAEAAVHQAVEMGASLIVLPELTNSGYVFDGFEEAHGLGETLSGATARSWSALSRRHQIVLVGGFCEIDEAGSLRNSAILFDRGNLAAVYRKVHLWDIEMSIFEPGDDPPPVVETSLGRISMMVCYDVEFPEWVRLAALQGADILCVPTNWPRLAPNPGPFPVEVIRLLGAANANLIYVAAAARVGPERDVDWVPGSGIAGPDGAWLTSLRDGPAVLTADLDLIRARDKMTSPHNHQLLDRRPELYQEIGSVRREGGLIGTEEASRGDRSPEEESPRPATGG